jgi:outer membrane protein OmpA-like peptidoglycan-associated protein
LDPKEPQPKPLPDYYRKDVVIYFDYNSFEIEESEYDKLISISKRLRHIHDCLVVIKLIGSADNVGEEDFNQRLSCLRTESVERFLEQARSNNRLIIRKECLGENGDSPKARQVLIQIEYLGDCDFD